MKLQNLTRYPAETLRLIVSGSYARLVRTEGSNLAWRRIVVVVKYGRRPQPWAALRYGNARLVLTVPRHGVPRNLLASEVDHALTHLWVRNGPCCREYHPGADPAGSFSTALLEAPPLALSAPEKAAARDARADRRLVLLRRRLGAWRGRLARSVRAVARLERSVATADRAAEVRRTRRNEQTPAGLAVRKMKLS